MTDDVSDIFTNDELMTAVDAIKEHAYHYNKVRMVMLADMYKEFAIELKKPNIMYGFKGSLF